MKNTDKENTAKSVSRKRKLKYGALAAALAAVVIALVILGNAMLTSFISNSVRYTDLTNSQIYTISETAKEYLKQIKAPITIKFAVPKDTVASNSQLFMVYVTATQFARLSKDEDKNDEIPDIKVEFFDSYKYPAQFEKYKKLASGEWASTNVIIESTYENEDGSEASYPLVYALSAFFSTSSSSGSSTVVGYNGERRFLLAFLQLAGIEQPVVSFTTGHGEPIGASLNDETNEYYAFMSMFEEFGFKIQYVDLSREELDPDCRLVIILDPQRDFIGKDLASIDGTSEIDRIAAFVADHGSLMVFCGPTGAEYTNLGQYLEEWGVEIQTKYTVEDKTNAIGNDYTFSVKYTTEGLGASVQKNYRNLRTVFTQAAPVQIIFTEKENNSMNITSSFRTSSDAAAYASETDVLKPADIGTPDGFDLFVVSSKLKYENNEDYYSYVLTCGSPQMLKYVTSPVFANRGILNVLITRIPLLKIPVDLDYKALENYKLSADDSQVRAWTVVLAAAIPTVVLVAGTVVVVRRKRK
ncbi:MAG: Gldg family protein [Clostridia bacterium]|nr:Gldg family protein [Clostridia bacterium]